MNFPYYPILCKLDTELSTRIRNAVFSMPTFLGKADDVAVPRRYRLRFLAFPPPPELLRFRYDGKIWFGLLSL